MPAATRSSLSSAIGTPAMAQMIRRGWIDDTPEIRATWDRFRADRNGADFQRLVEHYAPLVLHIATRERKRLRSFYRDGLDETLSDGLTALMRWIMRVPADMSIASVIHWARKTVRSHIHREAFKANAHRLAHSLDAVIDDGSLPMSQTIAIETPAPFTPILDAEFSRLVMKGLSTREKKIIRLMLRGDSGVEIGNALGVSRQRAHQLINRLLATLSQRDDLAARHGVKRSNESDSASRVAVRSNRTARVSLVLSDFPVGITRRGAVDRSARVGLGQRALVLNVPATTGRK